MEAKDAEPTLTESEFLALKARAAAGDQAAALAILSHFEPMMQQCSAWIGLPREDAMQSLRLAVLEWLQGEGDPMRPKDRNGAEENA
ncbi:hypothetical protein PA598K_06710 [Paenibacillus sp. 598K]|uniref:hypothetical protein n=1 Tax=Paenibacillus sp. 598K TaxID=1117987 RepID=UPI000FFA8B7B|nr:hypothetical protein [Paenibacillus sp. 598K]GBF78105.1 hypothetical protein PA598K_06710 [Paenibacillus sp. 598K]